ncbi:MAG: DUF1499 domain-containing protein, partial [Proteobacteria bacterium]|nr:DUF1499 domain-containing protein [Pseudomonadota bacterium]
MNSTTLKRIIILFVSAPLLIFLSCSSKTPEMVDGKLMPCPKSPNCVSSESENTASQIEPFTFHGSPEKAWSVLKDSIVEMNGNIQDEKNGYLRATFTSRLF